MKKQLPWSHATLRQSQSMSFLFIVLIERALAAENTHYHMEASSDIIEGNVSILSNVNKNRKYRHIWLYILVLMVWILFTFIIVFAVEYTVPNFERCDINTFIITIIIIIISSSMSHCSKSTYRFLSATTGTLYFASLLTHAVASKPSLIKLERAFWECFNHI